jgi:hypothetical protein
LRLHRALEAFRRNTGRPLSLSVGLAECAGRRRLTSNEKPRNAGLFMRNLQKSKS